MTYMYLAAIYSMCRVVSRVGVPAGLRVKAGGDVSMAPAGVG